MDYEFMESKKSPITHKDEVVEWQGVRYLVSIELPLERQWCFWMHRPCFDGKYENTRNQLHKPIASVQKFWGIFNNLPRPSEFFWNSATGKRKTIGGMHIEGWAFFKDSVSPDWEHKDNRKGTIITFQKSFTIKQVDDSWLASLLDLVGETIPCSDNINGIRVIDRTKSHRIEVWTDTSNPKIVREVSKHFMDKVFNSIGDVSMQIKNNPG